MDLWAADCDEGSVSRTWMRGLDGGWYRSGFGKGREETTEVGRVHGRVWGVGGPRLRLSPRQFARLSDLPPTPTPTPTPCPSTSASANAAGSGAN